MESETLVSQNFKLKATLLQRGDDTRLVGLRDLQRYYTLLNYHLLELSLTVSEASLICEALKDYRFENDSEQARAIWKRVANMIQPDQLDPKWRVNGASIHKIQSLTHLQSVALIDAVERYWIREQSNPHESLETKLSRVHLIKYCDSAL